MKIKILIFYWPANIIYQVLGASLYPKLGPLAITLHRKCLRVHLILLFHLIDELHFRDIFPEFMA
jgi:hypothetical protein